jgi:hypothetical protein
LSFQTATSFFIQLSITREVINRINQHKLENGTSSSRGNNITVINNNPHPNEIKFREEICKILREIVAETTGRSFNSETDGIDSLQIELHCSEKYV